MAQDAYAYGGNTVLNIDCPARHAGYEPGEGSCTATVAEMYDDVARDSIGEREGTVSRKSAERFWKESIERLKRKRQTVEDENHKEYLQKSISVGEEILVEAF